MVDGTEPGEPWPAVTIVIPTRDRPVLLERAIRSALAQSLPALEVIVVDDASAGPVGPFADPRVSLVRFETSRGVCAARNAGLARARGAWIAFLDDDDELLPGYLQASLDGARTSCLPVPVSVLSAIQVVSDDGETVRIRPSLTIRRGQRYLRAGATRDEFPFAATLLVPVGVMQAIGGWDERFRAWEDEDLFARLAEVSSIQGIEDTTYREHEHRGPRLGRDHRAMIDGALLTMHAHAEDFDADAELSARYWAVIAHLYLEDGRFFAAAGAVWRSFKAHPRLPRRPRLWATAVRRSVARRGCSRWRRDESSGGS